MVTPPLGPRGELTVRIAYLPCRLCMGQQLPYHTPDFAKGKRKEKRKRKEREEKGRKGRGRELSEAVGFSTVNGC